MNFESIEFWTGALVGFIVGIGFAHLALRYAGGKK